MASFPIFRFLFFLLHFGFPFFRFLFFRFPFFRFPFFRFPSIRIPGLLIPQIIADHYRSPDSLLLGLADNLITYFGSLQITTYHQITSRPCLSVRHFK